MEDDNISKVTTVRKQVTMSGKLCALIREEDLKEAAMDHVPGDMVDGKFEFEFTTPSWVRGCDRMEIGEFLKEITFTLVIKKEEEDGT